MFAEDEEEDAGNVVRYACLPSLVALQQMRNRLHLAFVGKKLMKWTAMATNRELRKMAIQITDSYETFREDVRNCYILLARARYFNPEINKMALENLCKNAAIKVQHTSKSIAGVKILQIEIVDYEFDSYEHLGIEKGGRAVIEAKIAWRELLKRLIMMCQLRIGFVDLELANKNATKRENVLHRVVVPRTMVTMKYILDQLEEREREDFYRIKKILANKIKAKQKMKIEEKKPEELTIEEPTAEEVVPTIEELKAISKDERMKEAIKPILKMEPKTEEMLIGDKLEKLKKEAITDETLALLDFPCGICKEVVEKEGAIEKAGGEKIVKETVPQIIKVCSCDKETESMKTNKSAAMIDHAKFEDLELGVIEIEVIETTKIIRVKNEDGTVSEKTKFIRKKRERMTPLRPEDDVPAVTNRYNSSRTESSTSKRHSQHSGRTVGVVTLSEPRVLRSVCKAQSETLPSMSLMADSFDESNIESSESYAISKKESDHSVSTVCKSSKQSLKKSSTELEEMLQLHDLRNYQNMIQISPKKVMVCKDSYILSDSEILLLNNKRDINTMKKVSTSNNEMKKQIKDNKITRSNSCCTKDDSENSDSLTDMSQDSRL